MTNTSKNQSASVTKLSVTNCYMTTDDIVSGDKIQQENLQ